MFENKMQTRFKALEKKALQHFESATKKCTKGKISRAIDEAVADSVSKVLEGLRAELVSIIKSRSGLPDSDERIAAAFDLARTAVAKLLLAGDIKSGQAGWLTFALKGIPEPDAEAVQAGKSSDDVTPIWLRERE